jgi:hypothetical protein
MIRVMSPNAQVKPTRVAEQTAWQALPAMLFVERHEFGLDALLDPRLTQHEEYALFSCLGF